MGNKRLICKNNEDDTASTINWGKAVTVLSYFLRDPEDADNQSNIAQAYMEMAEMLLSLSVVHGYITDAGAKKVTVLFQLAVDKNEAESYQMLVDLFNELLQKASD